MFRTGENGRKISPQGLSREKDGKHVMGQCVGAATGVSGGSRVKRLLVLSGSAPETAQSLAGK